MDKKILPHDHGTIPSEIGDKMLDGGSFESLTELFRLMSDGVRVKIFWLLCHCEECVVNISAILSISPSAASQRLKALKESGLVTCRRMGKEVHYTASHTPRADALHEMIEAMLELPCPAEERTGEEYDSQIAAVNEVRRLLISDLSSRYTIDELSAKFHINKTTLKSTFKTVYGKPVAAYVRDARMKRARELLVSTDLPISEIAAAVGYASASKFTEAFKEVVGVLPKDVRSKK